ncbi:LysR family transcriptional regulator [Gemmiger sp. An194]|uniref:LysR family transcriptional regulator n=1 Tax=Gemmiger sp. An194 TaxID=1965582 RepID=UPI000B367A1F|nr:LysR family transcriptional regulator [Gemmiger sp. An194]OUP25098.1 LysR family transcriptional regulator [Gemmiger sp. An194]
MELRVLQYFLAVAREQNISSAAESLHLSQPTLSTQLKALENELGKQLLIRGTKGSRKVLLTEEGMLLRKRAEEILELVRMTESEISLSNEVVAGDVYIGTGESDLIRIFARAAKHIQEKHPDIHYHILSGNAAFVQEHLDRGLIDFGVVYSPVDTSIYNTIKIPVHDTWGVLMRRDSPLAQKDAVQPQDLLDKPLILSAQKADAWPMSNWFGQDISKLNVVATYNLVFNASLLVEEGLGYAVCFDKLINVSGDSNLCFRPLSPTIEAKASIIWKRYQVLSKAAECFLNELQQEMELLTDL